MPEIDDCVHGFRLTRREYIEEIKSTCFVYIHEKTRAEVLVMSTDDDHKVFCTYFRTPPGDNTGVPHILEHAVLNGSRKYPVKEPFVELIKASLYTFLNAMTYDDKTVYPVSSRNEQDFYNLMDVYLDAVYHPKLVEHAFMQEGWHYELVDGKLQFSGVVYNEMLGATSSPDSMLYDEIDKHLSPHGTYGFNSGGDPEAVPDLTYQQFLDFHRSYYHPSNSKTVLYGDFDVEAKLKHLAEYFDDFEYKAIDSSIHLQEPFDAPATARVTYPISAGSKPENQSYVCRSWATGSPIDPEYNLAMNILTHILTGTTASPLRKALIESLLGEQTLQWFSGEALQTTFNVGLRGTNERSVEEIEALIDDTLQELADNGIDPRTVEASINSIEFRLREANYGGYSKGLIYALNSAGSWLYDEDPLALLKYEAPLAAIKDGVANGRYFERLIQEKLIDNPHRLTLVMVPDEEHEAKRLQRLAERLDTIQNAKTAKELAQIEADAKELREAQLQPDPPEALATIPKLPLSDVDRQAEEYPITRIQDYPTVLFSEQPTNGIGYIKFGFDTSAVPFELFPLLPVFCQIIRQAGTRTRDYVEVAQEIGIHTGGIGVGYSCLPRFDDPDDVRSFVACSGKALGEKIPTMVQLIGELICAPRLDDQKRNLEIIRTIRSSMQAQIANSGSRFAISRVEAQNTLAGRYGEYTGGLEQYRFLNTLIDRLSREPQAVIEDLAQLARMVFHRDGLTVHITGSKDELAQLQTALRALYAALSAEAPPATDLQFPEFSGNEALIIPSKVQFVCKGLNFAAQGHQYGGHAAVLNKLLSSDYLWNKVRVQGNAYGCFCDYSMLSGIFNCCSYRDPNLKETIEVFDHIADYLKDLSISRSDFEKVLIGTMGQVDSPRTESQKGTIALNRYLTGITQDLVQRNREQVLDCTLEDIRSYIDIFRTFAAKGVICTVGGEEKIRENADLFDGIQTVFAQD